MLTMRTEGDKNIVVARHFHASPEAVYRAHTESDLIRKWLLGSDGWTMPLCISDAHPRGEIRYRWEKATGVFEITGRYLELEPFHRIVHVERTNLPDPMPEYHIETTFDLDGKCTLLTLHMTLPNDATRQHLLSSGMERGMEASYIRLENLLRS